MFARADEKGRAGKIAQRALASRVDQEFIVRENSVRISAADHEPSRIDGGAAQRKREQVTVCVGRRLDAEHAELTIDVNGRDAFSGRASVATLERVIGQEPSMRAQRQRVDLLELRGLCDQQKQCGYGHGANNSWCCAIKQRRPQRPLPSTLPAYPLSGSPPRFKT